MDLSVDITIAEEAAFQLLNNSFIDFLNKSKDSEKTIEYNDSDTELLNFTQQIEQDLIANHEDSAGEDVNDSDNELLKLTQQTEDSNKGKKDFDNLSLNEMLEELDNYIPEDNPHFSDISDYEDIDENTDNTQTNNENVRFRQASDKYLSDIMKPR